MRASVFFPLEIVSSRLPHRNVLQNFSRFFIIKLILFCQVCVIPPAYTCTWSFLHCELNLKKGGIDGDFIEEVKIRLYGGGGGVTQKTVQIVLNISCHTCRGSSIHLYVILYALWIPSAKERGDKWRWHWGDEIRLYGVLDVGIICIIVKEDRHALCGFIPRLVCRICKKAKNCKLQVHHLLINCFYTSY